MRQHAVFPLTVAAVAAFLAAPAALAQISQASNDRAAIEALQARYMFALDWCNADAYRDAFTQTGTLLSSSGEARGDAIGAALRGSCRSAASPQKSGRAQHFFTNVVLDIRGNTGRGRTYWFALGATADHQATLRSYGYFADDLAKENGTWKLARRQVYNELADDTAAKAERPTARFASPSVAAGGYDVNRAAIEDLQARSLYAMDGFDPAGFADTFIPNGVLHMAGRVAQGRKAIESLIHDNRPTILGRAAGSDRGLRAPAVRHAISNVVVDLHGNTARSWAYWNTFADNNAARSAEVGHYGSYQDELEKVDGRWLFKQRTVFDQIEADRAAANVLPLPSDIDAGPPAHATAAEDRAAIKNLQSRYMFALDWQDPSAYAATFAPDGILISAVAEAQGRTAIREEVVKMRANDRAAVAKEGLRAFSRRHIITNLVLQIHGDHATGRAYWAGYNNDNPQRRPYVESYGHYEDELVKVDGHWLFKKRQIFNELRPERAASSKWPLLE